MQNYYRVLGIAPAATAVQVEQAYVRERTRLKRSPAAVDPALRARLAAVEAGYGILSNPRRRVAYDVLLAEEPPAALRLPAPHGPSARLLAQARVARRLNVALLAACLLLALDWALPLREYGRETVRRRTPVAVSSSLSDPQLAHRVRENQRVTVWETPLLGVVRRISAPALPDGPVPFQPYGGTIYGTFALLPLLLVVVATVGAWPGRPAETVVNTAVVSGLLAVLTLGVLLWL